MADDPGDRVILDMSQCDSPYQSQIDELFSRENLPLMNRSMNIQELFTSHQTHIVHNTNRKMKSDINLLYTGCGLRNAVMTKATTNTENPIEIAIGLGANYARRMTEFIVSDNTCKYA
jgi:hypothetical protein